MTYPLAYCSRRTTAKLATGVGTLGPTRKRGVRRGARAEPLACASGSETWARAMKTALLLIAHGSRQPEANADLETIAAELHRRGHAIVRPAFLELAEPDIATAGAACVAERVERVVLVPYFLSAGVHVRRDLEAHRQRLATSFPH